MSCSSTRSPAHPAVEESSIPPGGLQLDLIHWPRAAGTLGQNRSGKVHADRRYHAGAGGASGYDAGLRDRFGLPDSAQLLYATELTSIVTRGQACSTVPQSGCRNGDRPPFARHAAHRGPASSCCSVRDFADVQVPPRSPPRRGPALTQLRWTGGPDALESAVTWLHRPQLQVGPSVLKPCRPRSRNRAMRWERSWTLPVTARVLLAVPRADACSRSGRIGI